MTVLLWNVLIIGIVGTPLLLLYVIDSKFGTSLAEGPVALIAWLVTLAFVHLFLLPRLGLRLNPHWSDAL